MIEDPYVEPVGRPILTKYMVERVVKVGSHGYWIHCKSMTKWMEPLTFWMNPGSAIPPIGLIFEVRFNWNATSKTDTNENERI